MCKTNPRAKDFNELYSNLEDEFGEETMPRGAAVRILIDHGRIASHSRPLAFDPDDL